MKVAVRHHEKVSVLELSGNLSIGEDAKLREAVLALLKEGRLHIVVNLKRVPWMDSGGIGELIACHKRALERGGVIKLLNPTGRVYDLLQLMKLGQVFETFQDERDALASF